MTSTFCFRTSMRSMKRRVKQLDVLTWLLFLMVVILFVQMTRVYSSMPLIPSFPWSRDTDDFRDRLEAILHRPTWMHEGWDKLHPDLERYWREERLRRQVRKRLRGKSLGLTRSEIQVRFAKRVLDRLRKGDLSDERMLSLLVRGQIEHYSLENKFNVVFKKQRAAGRSSRDELLCQLKRQAVSWTLSGTEEPFSSLGWAKLVPNATVEQLYGARLKTCAVVSSAASIIDSGLGKEIDSHDAVLRYNAALTEGYEEDVGTKTTIRLINSQILVNPRFNFYGSELYKNVTLLAWDPGPYNGDLHRWFQEPDFDLFSAYVERRRRKPSQPFYILHPSYLWRLWDVIQGNTREDIQPNPPSSGFTGIMVMMSLCDQVDVYEFIPSRRQTDLCHYYDFQENRACTLGAYHPLLFEKALVRRLTLSSERDIGVKGRLTLPGFRTVQCET